MHLVVCFSSPQEPNQLSAGSVNPNTKGLVTLLGTHIPRHSELFLGQKQMLPIPAHSCVCTARRGSMLPGRCFPHPHRLYLTRDSTSAALPLLALECL